MSDHNCSHEDHDHDHDHDLGPQDNLFAYIDRSNVVALNALGAGPEVIKPWHKRLDEQVSLVSDADDQLILRIPFTGSIKLRALLLKAGPLDKTPSRVLLFPNENNLDFEDVADKEPTQEFNVAQGREVGEYTVMASKFSNLSSITLFFPASQGAYTAQIYYVGFLGLWSERKNSPIITVYEAQANLADHEKIQGTGDAVSSAQFQ